MTTTRLDIPAMIDILASDLLMRLADDIADALINTDDLLNLFIDTDRADLLKIMTPPFLATIYLKIDFCPIHECDLQICLDDNDDCAADLAELDAAIYDEMR
jgi:hypothetical protein